MTKWISEIGKMNPGKMVFLDSDCPKLLENNRLDIFTPFNPDSRHIFTGLNEKLMFVIAKSLTYEGFYPIVISPAATSTYCVEEWIGICIDKAPVLWIGPKPGALMSDWGKDHCAFDDVNFFAREGVTVFHPSNRKDLIWILNNLYRNPDANLPVYLRFDDFDNPTNVVASKVDGAWRMGYYTVLGGDYKSGYDTWIVTGSMMKQALELLERCKKRKIKVLNLFNLSRIDKEKLQNDLLGSERIFSLIEARPDSVYYLLATSMSVRQRMVYEPLGISRGISIPDQELVKDYNFYGARDYVLKQGKLDTDSLVKRFGY